MSTRAPATSVRWGWCPPPRALALVLAATLVLAGCPGAQDEPPPDPSAETPSPEPGPGDVALEQSCTNDVFGFQVDYPAGWTVNEANGLPPCSAFDPDDTSMPAAGEIPTSIAIVLHRDEVAFEQSTDFAGDFTVDVIFREETAVAGRRAVVAELEHTGDGLYDRGHRLYTWVLDADGQTITGVTHDVPDAEPPGYEERKRILHAMMASLRFRDPG
jgi:hypothetical protein